MDANQLDIASAIPLVERIIRNEPDTRTWNDVDIWQTVFELVTRTIPPRLQLPPTAFEKTVFDTPLRSSSASQKGIEQTHDEVDLRIREELIGRVLDNVGGSLNDTSKRRPGRTKQRKYANNREGSIQEVAGGDGQILHFKIHFLSGS